MLLQQEQRTQVTFFLADVKILKMMTLDLFYNGNDYSFHSKNQAEKPFWFVNPIASWKTKNKQNKSKQIKTNKTCFLQTNNKSKQNISIERKGKFLITKETISLLQNQFKGRSKSFGCVDETSQLEMCPNDGQQVLKLTPFIRGRKAKLFAGELQDKGQGQGQGQGQGKGKGVVVKVVANQLSAMEVVLKEYSFLKSLERLKLDWFPKLEGWIENANYCGIVTSPKGVPLLNTSLLLGSKNILG